ncbi:hlyD family secretion protein [Vibrio sp. JCM 19236]|nr:hlyD family secretion protein [Vibrio sp. JCM 19236]
MNENQVEVIESGAIKRLLNYSTFLIAICVAAFVTWSVLTKVDEIAKAKGAVIPEGERQVIQSELGGKLRTVFVKRGDLVEVGDR